MSIPKRLLIEYEDGSTKGIDFNQLSARGQLELSKLGLCSPSPVAPQVSKSYLLLRWGDEWQEVLGIDESFIELLRYYVLERVEEVGRMALEVEADYPLLFQIKRMPKQLDSLIIIGRSNQKFYGFKPKGRKEEGRKIEYVQYDGTERPYHYKGEADVETRIEEMMELLKTEINQRGLSAQNLLTTEPARRVETYQELAGALGIRAMEKQEDVYGFLQLMTERLAAWDGGNRGARDF